MCNAGGEEGRIGKGRDSGDGQEEEEEEEEGKMVGKIF